MKTHRLHIVSLASRVLVLFASSIATMLCVRSSFGAEGEAPANRLIVHGPVPGLVSSDHYAVRVRGAGADAPWQTAFVFKTTCKDVAQEQIPRVAKTDFLQ